MTLDQFIMALAECTDELPADCKAKRGGTFDEHLMHMTEQAGAYMLEGREDKAMQRLGFVQGALSATGRMTQYVKRRPV